MAVFTSSHLPLQLTLSRLYSLWKLDSILSWFFLILFKSGFREVTEKFESQNAVHYKMPIVVKCHYKYCFNIQAILFLSLLTIFLCSFTQIWIFVLIMYKCETIVYEHFIILQNILFFLFLSFIVILIK